MASLEALKAQQACRPALCIVDNHLASGDALAGPAASAGEFCGHGFKHGLSLSGFVIGGRYPGRVGDMKH